ncbi:MAG: hypothetical protein V4850_12225 [Myxococcota bacterium]
MTRDRAGRFGVGLGLLMAWASFGKVLWVDGMPYAPYGLDAVPMNAAVVAGATLVFLAAFVAFQRRRAEDVASVVIVLLFALGTQVMAWQAPPRMGVNGATMLPGAALLAWWLARRTVRRGPERERRGIEAACGIVAACYTVAVVSKLYTSGPGWASAGNIAMQITTQAHFAPEPLHAARLAAAASPTLCAALGIGTLLIEGGALLFVVPAARVPLSVLIVAIHLGISLLMGLHHYDWMFTAVGWALISGTGRVSANPA